MGVKASVGVLIVDALLVHRPEWEPGPTPVANGPMIATAGLRSTYFHPRAARCLYGSAEEPVRWHRWTDSGSQLNGLPVRSVEVLAAPAFAHPSRALVVIHLDLGIDPLGSLSGLSRLSSSGTFSDGVSSVETLSTGSCSAVPGLVRVSTIAYVSFEGPMPSGPFGAGFESWPAVDQWLQVLASATPPSSYRPDPELGREIPIALSHSWRAMVLRDGVAFVAREPDNGVDGFIERGSPEFYVRSIYTDAILLGKLQGMALHGIVEDLAVRPRGKVPLRRLQAAEIRLDEFRSMLWWQTVTGHGPANDLLAAYQRQHSLPQLVAEVVGDLTDSARLHRLVEADRTGTAINTIAVVGLPVALVVSIASIWMQYGVMMAIVTTAVTALTSVVVALLFRRFENGGGTEAFVPRRRRGR